ncbi:MAG: methylated-DNA--[protein]-cysteine S-methyltransferase [Bacteroidia bacterium]|nr:methylated-DNA--[protein]-cysteine S-methyltransferase [Bacteroidia bacterium]MCZ2277638.1 methylated-DNA--[protein]-cysteine S-methyltransferase [Bacteroidia bacterium]
MEIYYTTLQTPIGLIQISGSKYAIHSVQYDAVAYAGSDSVPPLILNCKRELSEYFNGSRKDFTINIEQPGTDFQQLVWKCLMEIPYGKTITYLELAKRVGNKKLTRAIGNANGSNHIPVIVPCHRVIGSNDSLTGYAGGLWRKKWLLDHEQGIQKLF